MKIIYLSVIALVVSANPLKLFAGSTYVSYSTNLEINSFQKNISLGETPAAPFLTGMTPANFELPSGWGLVRTQDFESGSLGPNEGSFGEFTTEMSYSGNQSLRSLVWKDDCFTGWVLDEGVVTTTELYISWYEYMEPQGRNNDEMFLLKIRKDFPGTPWRFQTMRWQYLNDLGSWETSFNITDGNLIFFCEGNAAGTTGSVAYYDQAKWISVGFGEWRQWEVYWKNNTPGQDDGHTAIFLNGELQTSVTDTGFGGSVDMSGPAIYIGGPTYTKIDWGSRLTGQCSENVFEIDSSLSRPSNFADPCPCPSQCPPNGYVPIFHRFVDDIIILQKGTSTHNNVEEKNKIIKEKKLLHNYPNPFNHNTHIEYMLENQGFVTLKIYDVTGREIITLENENKTAGTHTIRWNGTNAAGQKVADGMYVYQLKNSSGLVESRKMIMVK